MTKTKFRVHVCPIGFEVDRIVLAVKELHADRVWLIVEKNPAKERAGTFIDQVKSQLSNLDIEIREEGVDRDDLIDNLKIIKGIFEKEEGNDLHVNVSGGSKIQAIAGMMACMLFRDEYEPKPYYVIPDNYGDKEPPKEPLSFGKKDTIDLPAYEIKKPEDYLISALEIISKGKKITKTELAIAAIEQNLIESNSKGKKITQGDYAKLQNRIIKPLEETWEFIEVNKIGREYRISITKAGGDALKFLSSAKTESNTNS